MTKSLKRFQQRRVIGAKRYKKAPNRKLTRLEHARQNVIKSVTNTANQNYPKFVIVNKRETFQKLERNALDNVKDFGKQGFYFYYLIVLVSFILWYL